MRKVAIILCISLSTYQLYSQSVCKGKYYINPYSFFEETKQLRKDSLYDEVINILNRKQEDLPEIWHYHQLACMYALKGDTVLPFKYIYNHIDLQEFSRDILTDSDLEELYNTQQWVQLKDSMINAYLAKYPDITDKELSVQLWLMGIEDQRHRSLAGNNKRGYLNRQIPVNKSVIKQSIKEEKERIYFIADLLEKDIFPTYSMVGEEASNAFVLIIQHGASGKIYEKALQLMGEAVKKKDASANYYAMMIDRYLVQQGRKQIYATQYGRYLMRDSTGMHIPASDYHFSPIEDEKNVNKRRQEVGMGTIEEMAESLGFQYKYDPENDELSYGKVAKKIRKKAEKQRDERMKAMKEAMKK
ncbi:hypothetical protein LJC16_00045 [Bacteroidales bacterium OttesenSCG-928-C19]|nr:hypothetical protein [Bacteroidales bacterium OttesenSCG-928-C19]